MNTVLENLTGLNVMTDQVIAMDLLNTAKSGIRNYAIAITETETHELRSVLRAHLDESIAFHEKLTGYLMQRDWYKPYDLAGQTNLVVQAGQASLNASRNV